MTAPAHPLCRRSCTLARRTLPIAPQPPLPLWLLEDFADGWHRAADHFAIDVLPGGRDAHEPIQACRQFYRRQGPAALIEALRHAATVQTLPFELAAVLTRLEDAERVVVAA